MTEKELLKAINKEVGLVKTVYKEGSGDPVFTGEEIKSFEELVGSLHRKIDEFEAMIDMLKKIVHGTDRFVVFHQDDIQLQNKTIYFPENVIMLGKNSMIMNCSMIGASRESSWRIY